MRNLNLLVVGHQHHGKSTFSQLASKEFGISMRGTSEYAAQFMFERLKDEKGYTTVAQCHADRDNNRPAWYDGIREYNLNNPSQLIEDILKQYDGAEGLRHIDEYLLCMEKGLFNFRVFIDASERLPQEPSSSMTLNHSHVDVVLFNNDSEDAFLTRARNLLRLLVAMKQSYAR
jgi:hypothetical protein